MYIIEIKNDTGICERHCRTEKKAVEIAAKAANAGYVYFDNPELWKWQRRFEVGSVRVYSTKAPDVDIDF